MIQGYIRLLQRQRTPDHPEMAMLDAMLDATGRLTAIARQSSDLGNWLANAEARAFDDVPASAIAGAIADRLQHERRPIVLMPVPPGPGATKVAGDPPAIAGALLALAESMHRDEESATIQIHLDHAQPDGSVAFTLIPAPPAGTALESTGVVPRRAPAFDRGGAGLALIAASYVFDAHRASVAASDTDPWRVSIRFPPSGRAS